MLMVRRSNIWYGTYVLTTGVRQIDRSNYQHVTDVGQEGYLKSPSVSHGKPEYRALDRLVLFGYDYFEAFCERHHTEIIMINAEAMSPEQELVQDLLAIVTVFSARLHGLRSYIKALKDAALRKD